MRSLKFFVAFFAAVAFFACKPQVKPTTKPFIVETRSLKGDTVITSAVLFEGKIVCLQQDHKIFVLDSLLTRNNELTAKFSKVKVDFLERYNNTILIGSDKEIYEIDKGFELKNYNRYLFRNRVPDYDDSTWYVYSCSVGEWGGSVFFWNKQTNKTYSYPATGVQQVFKFHDTYVVSNYLAHLSGFSDYLFIKDPTALYEIKTDSLKTFCNWYMDVDSIKQRKKFPTGVTYYEDTFITRTLATFPHNYEIYSIYCTDSATILAKFKDQKLIPVDTLLHRGLTFHNTKTYLTNNRSVTSYEATWAAGWEGSPLLPYQNTGLVVINDNKITFLEFQTPHMRDYK